MKKNLFLRLFLLMAFSALLYSCRTEEELNPKNGEIGNLQYGISKEAFIGSLFVTGLKSSSSKNVASALTAEELLERLDLEKAHLNSGNGKEVFHVPVRTFGSYKRSLLSISENGNSRAVLLTYPNPEDHRFFYITDLNGNLLKEVKIGDNGKEMTTTFSGKPSVQGKTDDCSIVVYTTCSSGEHSFEWGNAYNCTFWHNTGAGTPPTLFTQAGSCPSGGNGTPIGGDGSSGGYPAGGSGTSPVGGGGPPKNQLTPANCVQNLDCENCNIPGDTNNDCMLSYDEAIAFNNNPCAKLKAQTSTSIFKNNITVLQGKTGDSYESGFRIGSNSDGSLQNQILQNKPGTQQVDMKIFSNTITLMHSHYDTLFPMFSPGDIILFNQWIVWAQSWNSIATNTPKIPINDLTFTVVTSNGNYSFNFEGTSTTALPNYTIQDLTKLNNAYVDNLSKATTVANVSGEVSYDTENLEKQFLKFMKDKINMPGLKLFRTETGGNTELSLNTNGTLKETNCP